jgi:raffinose/stachyose/melibiose transport system permease protein
VLFIAGIQSINETLYDAAKIDGAGEWQQFRGITLPSLRNEIMVALVTTMIAALRVFDLVFVTTRGGPGNRTTVASLWLYQNAFQINRVGYAAAIAVVLTAAILLISLAIIGVRTRLAPEE